MFCPPWGDQLSRHSRPSRQINKSSVSRRCNDRLGPRLSVLWATCNHQRQPCWGEGQVVSGKVEAIPILPHPFLNRSRFWDSKACLGSKCQSKVAHIQYRGRG